MDYCYLILQILDAPSDAPSEPSSTASLDNSSQINSMNEESASQDKRVADDEQPCSSRSAVESVGDCANEKPACQDKRVADDEQPCSSRSAVESVDDISNVYILSTADGVHVFMAKMIPCEPNSLVHNRSMLPGEAKFEIVTVINKQWQDFDPDFHWPGSYLVWKLELSTPQQLAFDCEGISEDRAKTVSEAGLPHGKKRKRNERNWSAVQKKRRNVTGGGKNMKEPCPASCRLKCSEKLDENTRKACFDEYWGTGSSERQWDFHLNNVRNAPVERRRQCDNAQGDSRRGMSKFYHLHDIHVCKTMYLNTLAISEQIVKTAFKKQVGASKVVSGDARGGKRRDMPEAREAIRRHISLFPTVDSHYCRKETTTAYLSDRLSVSKMHSLYKSWCIANNLKAQSYEYYLGVFNQDFKLSFFKRKKDKCLTCHAFENADVSPTDKTLIFREEECKF